MSILVNGSIAYDLLLTYDGAFRDAIDPKALDELSMAFVTPHFARHHGGTGANIAWNLSLLKQSPLLVGTVGNDGVSYRELLKERGIAVGHVEVLEDRATATAIVGTDDLEHQITFFHPGADAAGSWPDLSQDRDDISYAIVSPRDVGLMQESLRWSEEYGIPTIFDPGQQMLAFSEDGLQRAIEKSAGVVVNAYEWDLLKNRLNCTEENFAMYSTLLVVTLGEEGVMFFDEDGAQTLPACTPEHVINPTGAGDAFRAGLLTGLSAGWSTLDACRLGASIASFVVEIEGTLLDTLDLDEVWVRAEVTYGEKLPELPS